MARIVTVLVLICALGSAQTGEFTPTELVNFHEPVAVEVSPSVPAYPLPLDPAQISNWFEVARHFDLGRIRDLVARNGFGVLASASGDDMVEPYRKLKDLNLPPFVTADSLLHLYHVQFDETLREVEEREFHGLLVSLTRNLLAEAAARQAGLDGLLREAARRNLAYFSVALRLLDPSAQTPPEVANLVDGELRRIEARAGFDFSPIFVYREDYSQYVPRGHYTRSETLGRYFRAMMWYGRMGFLLKNSDLLPPPNAEIQTLQACLIADALARTRGFAFWDRIYAVTAFYVGFADDLTPYQYVRAMQSAPGELSDPAVFNALRAFLASLPNPAIYGGTGDCQIGAPYDPAQIDECLDKSKGLRFMSQRFVPDSYAFQNLVAMDYLGRGEPFTLVRSMVGPIRGFPRGLDVMDLLGSLRARQILIAEGDTEYARYDEQRGKLAEEFGAFSTREWNRNLYWGWLYTLKALLVPYGPGYPAFMQTEAWADRSLSAALASWTELRHDTILYAKQSYTPIKASLPQPVRGYVEPVPEFYARLLALTRMTRRGLDEMRVLSEQARQRLEQLDGVLERLLAISCKELANEPLGEADHSYIRDIGDLLERSVLGVRDASLRTTLVADVHTDANSGRVLEEGVGYVDLVAVVVPQPDGALGLAIGPVFSYYEFKWPMSDRLTDEAWRERVAKEPPARPPWTVSFVR